MINNNIFKLDTNLLPERTLTPEEKLIYKMLFVSIQDVAEYNENMKGIFYDAYYWIMSKSTDPFSFEWCLENLDLYALKEPIRKIAIKVKETKKDKKKYFFCTQETNLIVKNLRSVLD